MHTSERIAQSDFVYRRLSGSETDIQSFADTYPDYHPQDRVGLVSPRLEDGIFGAAAAVLSLATGFYDCLRSKAEPFFNYPQHLVFIGGQGSSVLTRKGDFNLTVEEWGGPWGWLDVWPETNWHLCPATPVSMLDAVYRHQVNRVFWPASFQPEVVDRPLKDYARRLLSSRLKSVWYYDSPEADVEVRASEPAADIIRESLERLSRLGLDETSRGEIASRQWSNNRFKAVEPEAFLKDMAICFTDG